MKKKTKAIIALGTAAVLIGGIAAYKNKNLFKKHSSEPDYRTEKQIKYAKELETAKKGEVVFFGDSITDHCDLNKYYPEFTTYNRGISGDTTHHLLERMNNVYELEPSVVVLLIGVNDFMNESRPLEDVEADYEKIVIGLKDNLPNAKIILESVYPGYDGGFKLDKWQDNIRKLNETIKGYCEKYDCIYADIYPFLLDKETNKLDQRYTYDGCHPSDEGYEVISRELTPYIREAYKIANNK